MAETKQRKAYRKSLCEKLVGPGGNEQRIRILEEIDGRITASKDREAGERVRELLEVEDRLSLLQEAEALIASGRISLRLTKELLRCLQSEGLEGEARRLEEMLQGFRIRQVEDLLKGEGDLSATWEAYLEVRDDQGFPQELARSLEERLKSILEKLNEGSQRAFFRTAAEDLEDRATAALGITDELESEERIRRFLDVRQEIRTFLKFFQGDARHRRMLRRLARRLRIEADEAKLAQRLERIFGYRFVKILETAVLAGILAVLALFILEWMISPLPEGIEDLFLWIDTSICGVFLFEFGLKMVFSPARLRYFLRHFIIDFLPSIPYGLLLEKILPSLENLDYLRGIRAARLIRLARLIRYVRAVRPVIRLFRLFAFAFRGLDRLVEHLAPVLNYNLIFFEPPRPAAKEILSVARLEGRLAHQIRSVIPQVPPARRQEILREQAGCLMRRLSSCEAAGIPLAMGPRGDAGGDLQAREVPVEEAIQALHRLTPAQMESTLNPKSLKMLGRLLRLLNVPLLRSLPIVGPAARAAGKQPPPAAVAAAGRILGQSLARRLALLEWCGDLSGIVTGPQLLDRVATTIMQATRRPAFRLLTLGAIFLLVKAALGILDVSWLNGVLEFLTRALGIPIIIVGLLSAAILSLGRWLKSIAGEATETYQRTAEAQYINLLEDEKLRWKQENLRELYDRVLVPEARVLGLEIPEAQGRRFLEETIDSKKSVIPPRELEEAMVNVGLLYRDYLDGTPFHSSDTKVAEQLIGNLSLRAIRRELLQYSPRERKRLRKLDLSKDRTAFGGPLLWFRFITESLALETAKLLLEYNQKAIPLQEIEYWQKREPERVKRFQDWVRARMEGTGFLEPGWKEPRVGATDFTALHFLSVNPKREHWIRERYGEDVLRAVFEDRRRLIRHVFGTWPFHRLPKHERTINVYQIYRARLSGGRIVFLPLHAIRWYLRGLLWLFKKVHRAVQEIRHPEGMHRRQRNLEAPFHVAKRKIERMRKPVLFGHLQMRALFDVEYLGLNVPWGNPYEGSTCEEDLARIDAQPLEREFYRKLLRQRGEQLARWECHLKDHFQSAVGLDEFLRSLDPRLAGRRNEILRAWALAYACDYLELRTLLEVGDMLESFRRAEISKRKKLPRFFVKRKAALLKGVLERKEVAPQTFRMALRWAPGKLLPTLEVCALQGVDGCRELARSRLERIAAEASRFSSFLTTLRATQTLSIFDLEYIQIMVRELGAYEGPEFTSKKR